VSCDGSSARRKMGTRRASQLGSSKLSTELANSVHTDQHLPCLDRIGYWRL
jgi:hypothetical protein